MTLDQYGILYGALLTAEIYFKVESEMQFNSELARTFAAQDLAKIQGAQKALEAIRALERNPKAMCERPDCDAEAAHCCDLCDKRFCSDHGSKGGDRQIQDVGAVAYPSQCWACGGFDADEEQEAA